MSGFQRARGEAVEIFNLPASLESMVYTTKQNHALHCRGTVYECIETIELARDGISSEGPEQELIPELIRNPSASEITNEVNSLQRLIEHRQTTWRHGESL